MILVLLAVAAQSAAQPFVQSPPPPTQSAMAQGDRPHRGPRQQVFVAPSGEPFRAAPDAPYPVADWFARANTAHDGKLTEAEFTVDFVRFVGTLDLNHDGVIDSGELQNYETAILPEMHPPEFGGRGGPGGAGGPGGEVGQGGWNGHHHHGDGEGGGNGGADRPKGAGRFGLLPLPEPIAAMDTASDGRITPQEVLAAAHSRFAQLDTAHRGYLQLSDLPETWTQSRRRMFQHREHGGGDDSGTRGGFGGGGMGGAGGDGAGGDQGN